MARRRRLAWCLAVAVGGSTLPAMAFAQEVNLNGTLTSGAAQKRTAALCKAAGALVDQKVELAQARHLYLRAISTGADDTSCAATGLKTLAAKKSDDAKTQAGGAADRARALLKSGFTEDANTELKSIVTDDPKTPLPKDLDPVGRDFDSAKALSAQGYDEQAQELVQAALKIDPNADVPDELVKGDRKQSWLRQVIGWVGTWIVTAGVVGLALLLLALVVKLIVTHVRRRIVTEPFVGGSDGAGATILADMRQRLERWCAGYGAHTELTSSIGPMDGLTLPSNVAALVPNAGVVTDLLGAIDGLLPARRWQIAGNLLPADPQTGVGIALTVSRQAPRRTLAAETIREADFQALPDDSDDDDALAWQRLALPCAALVLFTDRGHRWSAGQFDRIGTEKWRSFAMAASAAAHFEWDTTTALRLYRQAIAVDPDYKDAQFGLAVVELKRARDDATKLAEVDSRLGGLTGSLSPRRDELWYKAQFWRVAVRWLQGDGAACLREAERLFDPADTSWWWPADDLPVFVALAMSDKRKLQPALKTLLPDALAVLASASMLAGQPISAPVAAGARKRLRISGTGPLSGQALATALLKSPYRGDAAYNLACYYARANDAPLAMDKLTLALERGGPSRARYAWDDYFLENLKQPAHLAAFKAKLAAAGFEVPTTPEPPDSP